MEYTHAHTVRLSWLLVVGLAFALLPGCARLQAAPQPLALPAAIDEPIAFCGIDNFAWTITSVLARSAQPPAAAWQCLRQNGFTTVIRQNIEGGDGDERSAIERAGMQYIGAYQIADQTAYSPEQLSAKLNDVVTRLQRGERILVHDAGGRGRMGFWEAAFLMWDGWTSRQAIDRYIAFGWKIDCAKGGNGQMQGINEIAVALGQPGYVPEMDSYGTVWSDCARPGYMAGWEYRAVRWPEGGGRLWSKNGLPAVPSAQRRGYVPLVLITARG